MNADVCRRGSSLEARCKLRILLSGFSRVQTRARADTRSHERKTIPSGASLGPETLDEEASASQRRADYQSAAGCQPVANLPYKCFIIDAMVEGFWEAQTLQAGLPAPLNYAAEMPRQ
jgi:hypothetical protein